MDAITALVEDEVERRTAQPDRVLLTVPEYAARVGLSTASVYRHVSRGRLQVERIGGRVLVHADQRGGDGTPRA